MRDATALRYAARNMEKGRSSRDLCNYYPCFAARKFSNDDGAYLDAGSLANRFITTMAPGRKPPLTGGHASDLFLRKVNLDLPAGHDHAILALCFAAAMAETMDL